MVVVNYSKCLESQNDWADTLARQARESESEEHRENALLAVTALNRLIAISRNSSQLLAGSNRQD